MASSSHNSLFPPLHEDEQRKLLSDLFRFQDVGAFRLVHGGYMSQNFRVETDRGPFFLKQYRNRLNIVIHEIKEAEQFFADHGLPVILPTKDRYGREAFWTNGHWYSFFPFVEGLSPNEHRLGREHIISMATMLARFHEVGSQFSYHPFQLLRVGNPRKFHLESIELLRMLEQRRPFSQADETIWNLVTFKKQEIDRAQVISANFGVTYDCLLHGDFQYNNLFLSEDGTVTHVYDLERAALGPISYEVARSTILNCFDDGWEATNYAFAKAHLAAYRERRPLTFEQYEQGIRFYAFNLMFTTWIEARYLIYGLDTQLKLLERHAKRVKFFASTDLTEFARETFQ